MTNAPRTKAATRFYIADVDGEDVRWAYVPPAFAEQLETEGDALRQQRDELLAALVRCEEELNLAYYGDTTLSADHPAASALLAARAAIAKVSA